METKIKYLRYRVLRNQLQMLPNQGKIYYTSLVLAAGFGGMASSWDELFS